MALTILDRPQGCKLNATSNTTYSISSNGYGDAILTGGAGLADGDKIYIYQSFTSYNGFWYVVGHGPNTFRLRRYTGADYLEYTQSQSNVTIYECIGDVDYSCVHLPIVYTLQSGKWPTNNEDTVRNIVGFANDNGNVRITLDGSIDADALDWLKIANTSEDELDGPFQIITKHSPTQFTIDSPYSLAQGSAYTYASATAQKYYNNYMVNVRVYGGLKPEHTWAALKPYELIATLSLPPGSDNLIKVNIAEILKEKLSIQSNRPNFDSMPYDLDRFTGFYISYAEQYDDSNGTDVETLTGPYQSDYDFFQGFAVDAELPFKNRYSGFLSDYTPIKLDPTFAQSKFLCDADQLTHFGSSYYFDISFLTGNMVDLQGFPPSFTPDRIVLAKINYDQYGNVIGASSETFLNIHPDSEGVLRLPISNVGAEAYFTVSWTLSDGITSFTAISEEKRINVEAGCVNQQIYLTWKNPLGGFNYWLFTSNKDYSQNIIETQEREKNIYPQWPHSFGEHQDTVNQETYRSSVPEILVRAENLTKEQVEFIKGIKLSSLVQQLTTKYDRRTMIVDAGSFRVRTDAEGLHNLEFTIRDTANNPSPGL